MRPKREPDSTHFVAIRDVPDAPSILWDLLEEREPHANISHERMPTADEHLAFVTRHPYRVWYLIRDKGEWVGSAYLTKHHEIGLFVFKAHQGKGYGTWALHELARRFPEKALLANIAPGNTASQEFFQNLGFTCIQYTFRCDPRSLSPS